MFKAHFIDVQNFLNQNKSKRQTSFMPNHGEKFNVLKCARTPFFPCTQGNIFVLAAKSISPSKNYQPASPGTSNNNN